MKPRRSACRIEDEDLETFSLRIPNHQRKAGWRVKRFCAGYATVTLPLRSPASSAPRSSPQNPSRLGISRGQRVVAAEDDNRSAQELFALREKSETDG